jgi:aldehyde dehydrogenase (NAD+)
MYNSALTRVVEEGVKSLLGGVLSGEGYESGCYVKPAIAEAKIHLKLYNTKLCSSIVFIEIFGNSRKCT